MVDTFTMVRFFLDRRENHDLLDADRSDPTLIGASPHIGQGYPQGWVACYGIVCVTYAEGARGVHRSMHPNQVLLLQTPGDSISIEEVIAMDV
jgi:hypothetical protein